MILRTIRVVFIVAGLALLGLGTFLVADTKATGGHIVASWSCDPDQSSGDVKCQTTSAGYGGPGELGNVFSFYTMPLIGIGLIGAAIALGQFERPRVVAAAPPVQPVAAPGPQPMQHGQQPRWTGQNPGPPQQY